jgi:hypothetical protein
MLLSVSSDRAAVDKRISQATTTPRKELTGRIQERAGELERRSHALWEAVDQLIFSA